MSPFHLDDTMTKVVFITSSETPHLVYQAAILAGLPSNTAWLQRCVARGLADDLDLDYDELVAKLPPSRAEGRRPEWLQYKRTGSGNTDEGVR